MSEHSKIAWTDHTFNPWWGCTKISAGCQNCYAETFAGRFGSWFGTGVPRRTFGQKHWDEPLKWHERALRTGIRERVFCGSMCDICDIERPEGQLARLGQLIGRTPALDWLLLTKRPEAMAAGRGFFPHANVWVGTTVENRSAVGRIGVLDLVPALVHFLSCEPLLDHLGPLNLSGIDWVIVGAESGPRARPMSEDWVRSLRDQCQEQGVAFFYKQRIENGQKIETPELDGRRWMEFPKVGGAA